MGSSPFAGPVIDVGLALSKDERASGNEWGPCLRTLRSF